jgi:demethylmenaquinone methyltransferase/2-methoxy-6-polyprenyl-1,4-benzoquinol methylase
MVRDDAVRVDGAALSGRDRERYVAAMFDKIAGPYDRLNRLISLGRDEGWRRLAVRMAGVAPGQRVADLGCGTGDFIRAALPALGGRGDVVGIDLAPGMLAVARAKIDPVRGQVGVELRQGSAEETGLHDRSVDVVSMGWVIRNLGDRARVYREVLRVLKPGGRLVSLDTSKPASAIMRAGFAVWLRTVMPVLVRLSGGDREAYRYLADSTRRFLTARELATELEAAGFAPVETRSLMGGSIAIHVGRKRE